MDPYKLVAGRSWAIEETAFRALIEAIPLNLAAFGKRPQTAPSARAGAVAVIPIFGVINHHADESIFAMLFGGNTSTDGISEQLREALGDQSVGSIVLNIDSPGGTISGVPELAAEIRAAGKSKPVYAVANATAASAALWLGSQARAGFYSTPSGEVGSLGVYRMHVDMSEALAKEGIKPTFISAGKYKTEFSNVAPLTDEALEYQQASVDHDYALFIADVAKGRGVSEAVVRKDFGQGRMLMSDTAQAVGMIDGIKTLDQVIKLASTGKAASESQASNALAGDEEARYLAFAARHALAGTTGKA